MSSRQRVESMYRRRSFVRSLYIYIYKYSYISPPPPHATARVPNTVVVVVNQ